MTKTIKSADRTNRRRLISLILLTLILLLVGGSILNQLDLGVPRKNEPDSKTEQSNTNLESNIYADAFVADLYPGAVKTITIKIYNPNNRDVIVTSITAGSSHEVDEAGRLCLAGTVTTDAQTLASGLPQIDNETLRILPEASASYTLTTRMSNTASDGCKNLTFTIPLTAELQPLELTDSPT